MASQLALSHIEAERRLRLFTVQAVERIWRHLGSWDRADVRRFTSAVVPIVLASQRASVHLTDAYLARAMERQPLGVNADELIGAGVRNGTPPEEVYRRPFVTMWAALGDGKRWPDAFGAGLARAGGSAAVDVQLSNFRTAAAVGSTDKRIQRFQRVADGGACDFCTEVDGAILNSDDVAPLHNYCGCGVEPLTEALPLTPTPAGVAIHDHGELGPLLAAPGDAFTGPAAIPA